MTPPESTDHTILHEIGDALARHKLAVTAVFLLTVLTAYLALQVIADQYEGTARLLVKLGRENVEVPATVEKGGVLTTGVRKEEINSEIQLLQSRDLLEATLDEVGVAAFRFDPPPPTTLLEAVKYHAKALVRTLQAEVDEVLIMLNLRKRLNDRDKLIVLLERSLTVERERDSDVIAARLRLPDPALAVRVLEVLVRNYLERHIEVRRDPSVSVFYAQQVESYRSRLREIGSARQVVQTQRGISSIADQRALLLRRLRAVDDEIQDLDRERKVIARRSGAAATRGLADAAAAASEGARGAATQLTSYPSLDLLKKRLTELRIKYHELLQRYKAGSEAMASIEDEIHAVESLMLSAIDSMLAEKRPESVELARQLVQINTGEKELDSVEQERQVAIQNFLVYSKRLEEARIAEQIDMRRISNVGLLTAPERPIQPVYPRKLLIMAASLPVGLLLALGLAMLLEYVNPLIRGPRDLQPLGKLSYLGALRVTRRGYDGGG